MLKPHLNEKAGFVIFSIVGCLFLIIGFFNIKSRLSAPFKLEDKVAAKTEDQTFADLKLKDTDKDGLSDYDETFLYNTSPYIVDSDSDGDNDSVEIKSSTDPNCPKGKACVVEEAPPAITTPATPDSGSLDLSKTFGDLESGTGGSLTANALREALKQAGLDAATLDKINDADLMKLYEDTVKEQNVNQ